jgi:thioredoxin reductase (NADPH)
VSMAKPILVIVDENEDLLNQIQRDLERKYGKSYQVITASSGQEALMMLRRWREEGQRVAVVVADQELPDMDGPGFLKGARDLFPDAKSALLTRFSESEEIIETLK